MPERSNDELADALRALGSDSSPDGAKEGARLDPSAAKPAPKHPAAPARSVAPRPTPAAKAAPARPAAPPGAPKPATKPQRAAAPGAPASSVGAPAPVARSTAPNARPAAPTARAPSADELVIEDDLPRGNDNSEDGSYGRDDDDAVIVPAASMESLGHFHTQKRQHHLPGVYVSKSIKMRRTMIPILLTSGVLVPAFGMMKFIADPDAPLGSLPTWLTIVLILTGVVLLGLAGLNILHVREELDRKHPPAGT